MSSYETFKKLAKENEQRDKRFEKHFLN